MRILEDITGELETRVDLSALAACLAVPDDVLILADRKIGLRVLALLAEDKLSNETVEQVLKLSSLVSAVYDPAVMVASIGLGSKFEAEVLDDIDRGRLKELAILGRLTMTLLIPLPLPSILDWIFSIL